MKLTSPIELNDNKWNGRPFFPKNNHVVTEFDYCANPDCRLGGDLRFVKGSGVVIQGQTFHAKWCGEAFFNK